MLPERDRVFVGQMVEAASAAIEFTEGLHKETLLEDRLVAFAVVRASSSSVRPRASYRRT